VLACVRGEELAELFRQEGAEVVPISSDRSLAADDLVSAITNADAGSIVLLPNDDRVAPMAEEAAGRAVRAGIDVVVVPTASPAQGLAALAVHDPARRTADDTVAMAEAAAATRRGELIFAGGEALTWVGRCQPGDVLGLADGDVVLIRSDLETAACDLADRLLSAGGELVTAFVDVDTSDELVEHLAAHLRRTHPEIEFTHYRGGEIAAALLLGVE
jgi:dihydroxyacetone kinase-like predicted kinase